MTQRQRETAGLASSESQLAQARTAVEFQRASLAADLETRRADVTSVEARLAELQIATLFEEMAKRRMRVNVVGAPERVAACFVHGYRKLPVEISKY